MRRAVLAAGLAGCWVLIGASAALAGGRTYPPHPPSQTVPGGGPTALTGSDVVDPIKVLALLLVLGLAATFLARWRASRR